MYLCNIAVCAFQLIVSEVTSQVCFTLVKETHSVPVTYTGYEWFHGKGRTVVKRRNDEVPFEVNITSCCPGYKKVYSNYEPSSINCQPVCDACSNGVCLRGNRCKCSELYVRFPPQSNTCVPKCRDGHARVNGVCQPRCSKPCRGGKCIAPEQCSCDHGWELTVQGECVPKCRPECGNGICEEGNKCTCSKGYQLTENASPQCEPSCLDCHGICIAPDECSCPQYFEPKYFTANNEDCACADDCHTKCSTMKCVLNSTSTPAEPTVNGNNSDKVEPTGNQDPSNVKITMYIVRKTGAKPVSNVNDERRGEMLSQRNDDWSVQFWTCYFAFTMVVSFVFSCLVFWELYKK